MNPFFVTDFSISDSLKTVRKSVLIYETIIFNAYSDKYGDKKADEILQLLYDTIRKMLRLSEQMFILDDMKCIAMIESKRCQDVAGKICELFNQDVACFYDSEDLSTGFIERLSKKGNLKRHPLLSVRSEEIY